MKTFLKIVSLVVLAFSCLYLSISLFLNHLIIQDLIPTIVDSSFVSDTLVDVSENALSSMNINDTQAKQFVMAMQSDEDTQTALENYAETLISDVINQENTFDETELLKEIENKKDMAYELLQPNMTKEQFDQVYLDAMNNLDLQQMHDTMVDQLSQTIDQDTTMKNIAVKIYDFHNNFHIYLAIILMIVSTAYLVYHSIKEQSYLTNSIMITYILCGIFTFIIAVGIVFVLSAMASSSMHMKISSIRYMYLCGGIYIALGLSGYLLNVFLKKKA